MSGRRAPHGMVLSPNGLNASPKRRPKREIGHKRLLEPTLQWFEGYEVRTGGDGKVGVYTKDFNCRLAVFNANTACLQTRLKLLFERANASPVKKPKKRKPRECDTGEAWGPGSGNW